MIIRCSFCSKSQNKVKHLIGGVESTKRAYICNECVSFSHSLLSGFKDENNNLNRVNRNAMSPTEIKAMLDQYVIDQEHAKEVLSVAIYNHFKRIELLKNGHSIDKSNILICGPSGVGKTHVMKVIANFLNLPFIKVDATTFTEVGYVGEDVEKIVKRLLDVANGDIERAQHGIIYIDEIDKKRKKEVNSFNSSRDVSGEGVQDSLLKMVEGSKIFISSKHNSSIDDCVFDTTNVLFVVSGAFVGIEKIIEQDKNQTKGFGFTSLNNGRSETNIESLQSKHLIEYGLIPEFVGRFPILITMNKLDKNSLRRILTEPKNSLLSQYSLLFSVDGIVLEFGDKFVDYVADVCHTNNVGVRGLRSVIEKSLHRLQYDLPTLVKNDIKKVIIEDIHTTRLLKENEI